jgi:ATP-dependent RNA helicase RhlE
LQQDGIKAAAIHGNKSQAARTQALSDFKQFKIQALVATEVASRGLDIKELPHVVNYELPNVPEDYVHRIGRTGRAGASGLAVSLVSSDEAGLLKQIEKVLRKHISESAVPAFAPAPPPVREHQVSAPTRSSQGAPRSRDRSHHTSGGQEQRGRSARPQSQQQARGGTQRGGYRSGRSRRPH